MTNDHFSGRTTTMTVIVHLAVVFYLHVYQTRAHPEEAQPLTTFINAVDQTQVLSRNWTGNDPCNNFWVGIICKNGYVYELILESSRLKGTIPFGTLNQLPNLRRISLFNNSLSGPVPDLTSNSRALKGIWLHQNSFTGSIPDIFSSSPHLKKLYISDNNLTGKIPTSLALLPNLIELHLENNRLTGAIPAFNQDSLSELDISSNQLHGRIPNTKILQNASISALGNNPGLCGPPLSFKCPVNGDPAQPPIHVNDNKHGSKLSTLAIIGIVLGDFLALMIITLIFLWYYRRKYAHAEHHKHENHPKKDEENDHKINKDQPGASGTDVLSLTEEKNMLQFLNDDIVFDLEDLLRASAELLGRGSFGTAYKAVIENGPEVTVKRLRDLNNSGKKEFEQQMLLMGRIKHPNLVTLRAYYYAKDEKLLVYDYMPNGNLFDILHGKGGEAPDWRGRLKIAVSVARGLAYLHHEWESQKIPHGNIKSSNVLMDENMEARVADFGFAPLASSTVVAQRMAAFRAPEYIAHKKISHKSDVYSYGVLLLELLTGKVPASQVDIQSESSSGVDLPKWVNIVVREEWTSEVFDSELRATGKTEDEMMTLLQVAMSCVDPSPEHRPKMSQVQKMIEEISEKQEQKSSISSSPDPDQMKKHHDQLEYGEFKL